MRLAVDVGGTFTDFVLLDDESGQQFVGKSLTDPANPALGILAGLERLLAEEQIPPERVERVVHATTLITNALIERAGARTGLITTRGMRDLLEIGRELRYDLYDLFLRMPEPLVPRSRRLEVEERLAADGSVVVPLDPVSLRDAVDRLLDDGVESIAICFLHSYLDDAHERQAAEQIAAQHPELHVSISSDVAREIREYERLSTTAANAYVQPLAHRYLSELRQRLEASGIRAGLQIMLSNGGFVDAETAGQLPARLVESGPAAGAVIAGYYGQRVGAERVLAFDMGGTTAKLCLVDQGQPAITDTLEVARVHRFKRGSGLPIRAPSVELVEIGAGGGSIARIDELGLLTVGPQSAGADPGPACYGFGGDQPTVTDADLVLGFLNPDYFLGGRIGLDGEAALAAIERHLSDALRLRALQVAWGIHDMVNENMATAASLYLAEKGKDPRDYTLVATGGAGPVHAIGVAHKIGIGRVLVPPAAGVASAAGLLVAPPRIDFGQSYLVRLDEVDWDRLNRLYADLERRAERLLAEVGVSEAQLSAVRTADLRYTNQGHQVAIPVPGGQLGPASIEGLVGAFEAAYRQLYGRTVPGVAVEAVTWRLTMTGPAASLPDTPERRAETGLSAERTTEQPGWRPVYVAGTGGLVDVPVIRRDGLRPGATLVGPAIIEEPASTVVVGPGDRVRVDRQRNLHIHLRGLTSEPEAEAVDAR